MYIIPIRPMYIFYAIDIVIAIHPPKMLSISYCFPKQSFAFNVFIIVKLIYRFPLSFTV